MGTTTFDAFEYAHQLRNAGITEQQAEIIAKQTGHIVQLAVEAAKDEVHVSESTFTRDLKESESMLKRDLKEMEVALKRDIAEVKRDIKELELATKRDLKEVELLIEKSKNSTLLWMFAMLTGVVGVMAKGFHWF